MKYASLGSGSKGNATIVQQDDVCVLIDCGFSKRSLMQRLLEAGVDPGQLHALFVTHEHGDHARGVVAVCDHLNIPFYASFGTARKMDWVGHDRWRCIRADEAVRVGSLEIIPVVVPHDAQEPLQFVLQNADGHRLGILSDLGSLTPHLVDVYQGCHGLQVEANHDPQLLQTGPYPPSLRARVAGAFGHLSNQQCAEFIRRVNWPGLRHITAGHISEKNNDRYLISQVLAEAIGCEPHEVTLLEQDMISPWYHLNDQ